MKKRSEKFDDLPIDFDPEVIWEGIEKPTKGFPLKLIAGSSFLIMVSVLLVWFGVFQKETVDSEPFTQGPLHTEEVEVHAKRSPEISGSKIHEDPSDLWGKAFLSEPRPSQSNRPKAQTIENSTDARRQMHHSILYEKGFLSLTGVQVHNFLTEEPLPYAIPDSLTHISLLNQKSFFGVQPFVRFPFISVQAAVGTHVSQFISEGNRSINRQIGLEEPQIDFHAGVDLGWILKQNYTVSIGLAYSLIKDRIENSRFSYEDNSLQRIDYRLYNHYHLLNTRIEVGKRFLAPNWYYDVRVGGALNVINKAELDYFDQFGALADQEASHSKYDNVSSMFATYRLGVGKVWSRSLNKQMFGSFGLMGQSPIQLTHRKADYQHRVVPMYMYAELGWEF